MMERALARHHVLGVALCCLVVGSSLWSLAQVSNGAVERRRGFDEVVSVAGAREGLQCARKFMRRFPVIVTSADAAYEHVLEAWLERAAHYGLQQILVIALDDGISVNESYTGRSRRCVVRYPNAAPAGRLPALVGLSKFEVTCALLKRGISVLYSELDVVWLKDPWRSLDESLKRREAASFAGFKRLEAIAAMDNDDDQLNIGFVFAPPSPRVVRFFETLAARWRAVLEETAYAAGAAVARDQALFWEHLRDTAGDPPTFARLDPVVFAKLTKRTRRPRVLEDAVDPARTAVIHVTGLPTALKLVVVKRLYEGSRVGDVMDWLDEATAENASSTEIRVADASQQKKGRDDPASKHARLAQRLKDAQRLRISNRNGAAPRDQQPPAVHAMLAICLAPIPLYLLSRGLARRRATNRRGAR